jgi:hypothetical protein
MKPLCVAASAWIALLAGAASLAQEPSTNSLPNRFSAERDVKATRLREGSKFHDRSGRFQVQRERICFFPDDKLPESVVVLENLALERVSNGLIDPRGANGWLVSGTITEFRGVNYLMITRAVMRDGESPRTP